MSSSADVCRLCETSDTNNLRHIFNINEVHHENLAHVIFVMTEVKVEPTDVVSQKICARCCNIVQKMYKYRQDAQKQDQALKEKYSQLLTKGIKLPNTVTIKQKNERLSSSKNKASTSKEKTNESSAKTKKEASLEQTTVRRRNGGVHPSITKIFQQYPTLKIQKKAFASNFTPTVSLKMGEVEKYFKRKKLNMKSYTWQPQTARKKTSSEVSDSTKTVAPIKISRRILEKHDANLAAEKTVSRDESVKGRKRKRSSSIDTSVSNSTTVSYASTSDTNKEINKLRTVRETTPIEDSKKTESSTPETPGSLLLVSRETKSQPIFVCDLCGSVHNSNGMLKNHLAKRHMVCQFCKKRFKSLEAKSSHIENDCTVKQIMNSNFPKVTLQKIERNLRIRQEFRSAFNGWDPVPGLEDCASSSDQVNLPEPLSKPVKDVNGPKTVSEPFKDVNGAKPVSEPAKDDGVIEILSDDDEPENTIDPLLKPKASETKIDTTAFTVSAVKPDVRIKNNSVLGSITQNASDIQVIKELLGCVLPKPQSIDLSTQTDFPGNHDIKVNLSDGNAELKNLREQLKVFKVPLTIKHGNFNASYKSAEDMYAPVFHYWSDLPVIDVTLPKKGPAKPVKNFFVPHSISTSPTLERMNEKNNKNIAKVSSNLPPLILSAPSVPSPKISLPTNNSSRTNHHPVSSNNNLTPQLSIPKPSVNYSPSGTGIATSNSLVILNPHLNAFSGTSASNGSSKPGTAVNSTPGVALGMSSKVVNPVSLNTSMNSGSQPTVIATPMIRVRSVKELQ